jgi:hypothetical protein
MNLETTLRCRPRNRWQNEMSKTGRSGWRRVAGKKYTTERNGRSS